MNDATTMPDDTTLMIRRTFDADMKTLFAALTDPAAIGEWFCPGTFRVARAEGDLRVGGSWVIEMISPEGNARNVGGEYLAIDPPNSVSFTWAWQNEPAEVSHVEYRLSPADAGTTLTLIHTRLPSVESRDMHGTGWNAALDKLIPFLAR